MDGREIVLVIGGCRSGKSRHALTLAEKYLAKNKVFIATCVARDDELAERIEKHRRERGKHWQTVEIPLALPKAVDQHSGSEQVVLVDCLTLWATNIVMEMPELDMQRVYEQVEALSDVLNQVQGTVILVSNEVGTGIVPENKMARFFRDAAGFVNQSIASVATTVIWMVAGIPVTIKSPDKP